MNILIPMAGAGKRFADAGYTTLKPLIPTTERRDGKKYPMVVCAVRDVPGGNDPSAKPIFVVRTDCGGDIEAVVKRYYPKATVIGVDRLTEGQACTCLLAKELIDNDEPLFIAGCDNGMEYDAAAFEKAAGCADALIFTYRHNEAVLANPRAYGWVRVEGDRAVGVSVKEPISDDPMNDHAIVASFWFRRGADFVSCAEDMIAADDRVNGEFYVDKVGEYCLKKGLDVRVFEIDRYLGWGTPKDYEDYEKTLAYWRGFTGDAAFIPKDRSLL